MRYLDFTTGQTGHSSERAERLILAIDASPSMDDADWPPSRLAAAQEAAIALIERKCRITPEDQVGVVAYASRAWWVCAMCAVGQEHRNMCRALRGIKTKNATNITAALKAAESTFVASHRRSFLDRLLPPATAKMETEGTPRIILLTDGGHNYGVCPRPVAESLKQSGVTIDCVGIGGEPSDVDEPLLKAIASVCADGVTPRYAFIGDKNNLIEKFEELAGRITR